MIRAIINLILVLLCAWISSLTTTLENFYIVYFTLSFLLIIYNIILDRIEVEKEIEKETNRNKTFIA